MLRGWLAVAVVGAVVGVVACGGDGATSSAVAPVAGSGGSAAGAAGSKLSASGSATNGGSDADPSSADAGAGGERSVFGGEGGEPNAGAPNSGGSAGSGGAQPFGGTGGSTENGGAGGEPVDFCAVSDAIDRAYDCTADCANNSSCSGTCGWKPGPPYERQPGGGVCSATKTGMCTLGATVGDQVWLTDSATKLACDASASNCQEGCVPACGQYTDFLAYVLPSYCAKFTGSAGVSIGLQAEACDSYKPDCRVIAGGAGPKTTFVYITLPDGNARVRAEVIKLANAQSVCPLSCP